MKKNKPKILPFLNNNFYKEADFYVFLYLIFCLIIVLFLFAQAHVWMNQPFIGGFLEKDLVFNTFNSSSMEIDWPAFSDGYANNVKLVSINGEIVRSPQHLNRFLREYSFGDEAALSLTNIETSQSFDLLIKLIRFPFQDRLVYFYLPFIVGFVFLVCAFWLLFSHNSNENGRIFSISLASISIAIAGAFDLYTTQNLVFLWFIEIIFLGCTMFDFVLNFPHKDLLLEKYKFLQGLIYTPLALLLIAEFVYYFPSITHQSYLFLRDTSALISGMYLLSSMAWMIFRKMRTASTLEREQIWLIILSGAAAFAPAAVWFSKLLYSPYLILSMVIFPVIVSYTIHRYQLVQAGFVLSQGVVYGIIAVLIVIAYALIVAGLQLLIVDFFNIDQVMLTGLIFFILAVMFMPLKNGIEKFVNRVFFRGKEASQDLLQEFASDLTKAVGLMDIVQLFRKYINSSLQPQKLHIFIFDPLSDQYVATLDELGEITSQIRFPGKSIFVTVLKKHKIPFSLSDSPMIREQSKPEAYRIKLLAADVYVPLTGQEQLLGWFAMFGKEDGAAYSHRDYEFMEAISDQASLALERAQVVANLEDRVREMNVLARIAQGINITLELDDILELIYAQTTQIISADDFHIYLMDIKLQSVIQIFCIQENERLQDFENLPEHASGSLENEIILKGETIRTPNYSLECKKHNLVSDNPDLSAWMGVPLYSGADIIGALSLGKREKNFVYTQPQLSLLRQIADQAAGAIVKARLLKETQMRARQMASLNEISRQLTSNLEFNPLLNNILHNAVQILDCQAGCLSMFDTETDELVFRVLFGQADPEIEEQRIARQNSLAGTVLDSKKPLFFNNVQNLQDWKNWYKQEDDDEAETLLIVPLETKDRPIGVIEILNKKDGSQFNDDDVQLLTAFASQAAVAIENARLYTLTDQELTSRLEELSIMQRISRELNTSLDLDRALQITLEWTLNLSKASAGYIGVLNNESEEILDISAHQGYKLGEMQPYTEAPFLLERSYLRNAIEGGKFEFVTSSGRKQVGLLTNSHSLVAIPVRQENNSIGLLVLEDHDKEHFSEKNIEFLQRIMDHASIAITNAQLYSAVAKASVAKSEFVSFVSHELKNPMTSIKGYAELLAAGAVGEVSEAQMNFLKTILTNVDRMATLVSDLADEARIESGRLRLDFESIELKSVIEEVVRSEKKLVEEREQNLIIEISDSFPEIWADRTRLVQIFANLISNSRKYTQNQGEIFVSAEIMKDAESTGAAETAHFWVKDDGYGIDEENSKKIFQKFFRVEDIRAREVTGTGLGLNITKSLVEAMGGAIWFESELDDGTTFHFTMPVADH